MWFDDLIKKYPRLFKSCKWIECGEGWKTILDRAFYLIDSYLDRMSEWDREVFEIDVVKEKYGRLRMGTTIHDYYISGVIAMAESMSGATCEYCGMPGKRRGGGWIQTLCDKCYECNERKE